MLGRRRAARHERLLRRRAALERQRAARREARLRRREPPERRRAARREVRPRRRRGIRQGLAVWRPPGGPAQPPGEAYPRPLQGNGEVLSGGTRSQHKHALPHAQAQLRTPGLEASERAADVGQLRADHGSGLRSGVGPPNAAQLRRQRRCSRARGEGARRPRRCSDTPGANARLLLVAIPSSGGGIRDAVHVVIGHLVHGHCLRGAVLWRVLVPGPAAAKREARATLEMD